MTEEMKNVVREIIDDEYGTISEKGEGYLVYEMYADYRDEMDAKTACEILGSSDPAQALEEKLDDWYFESRMYYEDELMKVIRGKLGDGYDEYEDEIREFMQDYICFDLPRSHFLKQKFYTDIMLDTGDGNYDYTLNSVYPCWYGRQEWAHNDKAGIVWLAKQQGYKKGEFRRAMNKGDLKDPKGFLQSMRQELANLPSSMSTVTFLVKMTLEDLIRLNELIRLQDRNGRHYDATENPYCGYIVLDKKTETGLYDPWSGGGSVFEVELEKDVRIPIRFIRSALPDGGDGYSIDEVYGMCGSCWRDTVKKIHAPVAYERGEFGEKCIA